LRDPTRLVRIIRFKPATSLSSGELMFNFVRPFFSERNEPIGIDFGTTRLRLAQTSVNDEGLKLLWAAGCDVPRDTVDQRPTRSEFFTRSLKTLLSRSNFQGRRAVLTLPAFLTHVRHVRVNRTQPEELPEQLRHAVADKLSGSPDDYVFRHVIAGEFPGDQGTQVEAIVMAAPKRDVAQLLDDARCAKLDVVGLLAQPAAIIECFQHIYRRASDAEAVNLFVDFGTRQTRVLIGHAGTLRFARSVARTLFDASAEPDSVQLLADDIDLCRRYHESIFPEKPITRIIYVGAAALSESATQSIAEALALPAQVGDPLVRFNRSQMPQLDILDRRKPQPEWAAAIGASLSLSNHAHPAPTGKPTTSDTHQQRSSDDALTIASSGGTHR
jgi:hypothetical protein